MSRPPLWTKLERTKSQRPVKVPVNTVLLHLLHEMQIDLQSQADSKTWNSGGQVHFEK